MKPLEITDIEKVDKTLKGNKISDSTEDELKAKLKVIYVMIGLRPQHFPVDEEKIFLHNYIYQKYGNKTLNELVLAFDLAIQGQLDVEDVKVYDQFSCEYLAKIMNAYRVWLKRVSLNASKFKKETMQLKNNATPLSDEDKAEWLMDWKIMDEVNIDLIPLLFYNFLSDKKHLNITNKQKWEYTEKATQNIKVKLYEETGICKTNDAYIAYNKFCNQEKEGFEKEFKGRIVNRAKRLIVFDYLKDKLNQDETLPKESDNN